MLQSYAQYECEKVDIISKWLTKKCNEKDNELHKQLWTINGEN